MAEVDDLRQAAMRRLPVRHAEALRLRDGGASVELIAERMSIDPLTVGPLLAVAEAKLAAVLSRDAAVDGPIGDG
jgi:DNA-directed RNA polymerase specialized sigma24 family protein